MLDSDRRQYARQAAERHARFVADLPTLVDRLRQMLGGYPSGGLNGGRAGDTGSQPERLAGVPDKAAMDLARVDRLVLQAHGIATELDAIRASTLTRRGSPEAADEGCRSCARVRGSWSPAYRKDPPRCRWCYDRWLELERDPPALAVEWYLQGRKVSQRMMRDALDREALAQREPAKNSRQRLGKRRGKRARR